MATSSSVISIVSTCVAYFMNKTELKYSKKRYIIKMMYHTNKLKTIINKKYQLNNVETNDFEQILT